MMFASRNSNSLVISEYEYSGMTFFLIIFIYDFEKKLYWLVFILSLKVK